MTGAYPMSDKMHPLTTEEYADWMFTELDQRQSIFGMPDTLFFDPSAHAPFASRKFNRHLEAPIGVAAGPHSQLTQNILSAWLTGARFIELKTVQILDELEVTKPCIDMEDVGYNCEWSQELRIEQSFEEYLKAWILIHVLQKRLGHEESPGDAGTIFNMSVGYNLEGIKSAAVQQFISRMRDSSQQRDRMLSALAGKYECVAELDIPSRVSDNVTLSTMHGCPPEEIERIALFLIEEMGLHTTVKFNPTLLGPQLLREILNGDLGYDDIHVPDAAFEHDPCFDDAVSIIRSLSSAARKKGVDFGVKLSNTLETCNVRLALPETEEFHYMSGRALHPLTVNLAKMINDEFKGEIPISFAAGADAFNLPSLVACRLAPVTVSSDLLKPGGYGRLAQYVENLSGAMQETKTDSLDDYMAAGDERLVAYAKEVREDERYRRKRVPLSTKTTRPLEHFDCIAAPCRSGCPTYQNVPDYLHLVAHDRVDEALAVILNENPLPGITGCVCDHPCTAKCVRSNYDYPLLIREIKRFVAEEAEPVLESDATCRGSSNGTGVAVVGAGPAGLACAYYLALGGFKVSVFDSRDAAGGIPEAIIPPYRLSDETIRRDVDAISALGVEFQFGCELGKNLAVDDLHKKGFKYVFIGAGAAKGRHLDIEGEGGSMVYDCLDFLRAVRGGALPDLGSNVIVVGGGNSAMDAARTAWRIVGLDGSVTVVYRRTIAQMPAGQEEIEALFDERIEVRELLSPKKIVRRQNGNLAGMECQRNKLGKKDDSGRARPVPIPDAIEVIEADAIIVAVSQGADVDFLEKTGIKLGESGNIRVDANMMTNREGVFAGGDAVRGASTIITAIADGRAAAREICQREGITIPPERKLHKSISRNDYLVKRTMREYPPPIPTVAAELRTMGTEVNAPLTRDQARTEAGRCLGCDEFCGLCQTVCPNRANLIFEVTPISLTLGKYVWRNGSMEKAGDTRFVVEQESQIVNIAEFCNECGNCRTFCPTAGAPYLDKPRLCLTQQVFEEEEKRAFRIESSSDGWSLAAKFDYDFVRLNVIAGDIEFISNKFIARFDPNLILREIKAGREIREGEEVCLDICAEMFVLGKGLIASANYLCLDQGQT